MRTNKHRVLVATAGFVVGVVLAAPAVAQDKAGFAAMQGVDAQPLSAQEMDATQGQMSLTNLNELTLAIKNDPRLSDRQEAKAIKLWTSLYESQLKYPRLQPYVDALFEWTRLNVYPNAGMCAVNADFCAGPFPGTW